MSSPPLTSPPRSWLVPYLFLAAIWGSSFLFIKVGITQLHPVYVALGRAASGALALLVLLAVRRLPLPRDPRVWGHLAVVGVVGVALPFTLFGYGERQVPSILAGIWNAATPLLVLPIAVYALRTEKMTARRGIGLGIGFAGVLTVLGVWNGAGGAGLAGQAACFAAACCYGVAIPYQRRFLAGRPESGPTLATGQLIMATLALAVAGPLLAGAPPAPWSLSPAVLASVLLLGAVGTGVAFALNFQVIRVAGASTSASVTYVIPLFATIEGVALLHERLTWYQPVGALVVLLGCALSQNLLRLPPSVRGRPGQLPRPSAPAPLTVMTAAPVRAPDAPSGARAT